MVQKTAKTTLANVNLSLSLFPEHEFSLANPLGFDPQFQKPSELIYIHNNLDDYPRRVWNVLLWKSRPDLLTGEREFKIEFQELIKILSGGKTKTRDANYEHMRDALEKLRAAPVVMVKKGESNEFVDEMTRCGYISGFTWDSGDAITWSYHERLLKYLIKVENIPLLDISVVGNIKSKHATALYEICCQLVMTPEIIMFDIPTAVRLFSGKPDGYYVNEPRFFKTKCLEPALIEVNTHSEFIVEPIYERNKYSKLVSVGWIPRLKDEMPESLRSPIPLSEEMKEALRETEVYKKLISEYGFTASFAIQILTKYPYEEQKKRYEDAFLRIENYKEYCISANKVIGNLGAFTYKAIDRGLPFEGKTVFDPRQLKQEKIAKEVEQRLRSDQDEQEKLKESKKQAEKLRENFLALPEEKIDDLIEKFKLSAHGKIKMKGEYWDSKIFLTWLQMNHSDLIFGTQ